MEHTAVPEPMGPCALRCHDTGVRLAVLRLNLLGREDGPVVLRHAVLPETGAVGRRIELERLLEHDGLAIRGLCRCEANEDILGDGNADSSPERSLERE